MFLFQKEIAELSSNVAGIHLDQLLDYSEKVEGKKGQVVIEKMFKELKTLTDDILKANDKRVQQGFLPYPYLLPEFISNSASTWFINVSLMYNTPWRTWKNAYARVTLEYDFSCTEPAKTEDNESEAKVSIFGGLVLKLKDYY